MTQLQAPPSINDLRTQTILALLQQPWPSGSAFGPDLSPVLVNRLASVPASALPFLAWEWDILSPEWLLISGSLDPDDPVTPDGWRALLEAAIPLHQQAGTAGAIKKALAALGWPSIQILEGQDSWGGSAYPSDQGWAVCRLFVTAPGDSTVPIYDVDDSYAAGSQVAYNGNIFLAEAAVAAGIVPQFTSFADITDPSLITDIDNLVQTPWVLQGPVPGDLSITPQDVLKITTAFNFFKPVRVLLDSVWVVMPGWADDAPTPTDQFSITAMRDLLGVFADIAPEPSDTVALTLEMPALADAYPGVNPFCNGHYTCTGHNCGANQPLVADGPLTINGVAHV